MSKFVCGTCGKEHGSLPMDLAYRKPLDYFEVPEAERAKRIFIDDDLCVIDEERFFIRGVLPIPIHDGDHDAEEEEFRWGVWVEVEEASFRRYLQLWDAPHPNEPPFWCRLSAALPGYPDTDTLEGDARLRGANARPLIHLGAGDHPLIREQRNGIIMARVHEILESAMPQLFPQSGER